jgi:hypothetical protein
VLRDESARPSAVAAVDGGTAAIDGYSPRQIAEALRFAAAPVFRQMIQGAQFLLSSREYLALGYPSASHFMKNLGATARQGTAAEMVLVPWLHHHSRWCESRGS